MSVLSRSGQTSQVGFEEFVATSTASLVRFAYLLCADAGRAEDLVQDALLKLDGRWRSKGAPDRPVAFARRMVLNDYLGWRRLRASTEITVDRLEELAERRSVTNSAGAAADHAGSVVERDAVWRVLGRLPQRQRAVLVLRYYERCDDQEIAALLGCAVGTVRSLAARAFATLREEPTLTRSAAPVGEESS